VPLLQGIQDAAFIPAVAAAVPAGHNVQLLEFETAQDPALQGVQEELPAVAAVPAPHTTQLELEFAPAEDEADPAGQRLQEPARASDHDPAAQVVQEALPAAAYDPAAHTEHDDAPDELRVPGPHETHLPPGKLEYCPAGQGAHTPHASAAEPKLQMAIGMVKKGVWVLAVEKRIIAPEEGVSKLVKDVKLAKPEDTVWPPTRANEVVSTYETKVDWPVTAA